MSTNRAGQVGRTLLVLLCVFLGACERSTDKMIVLLADVSKTVPAADIAVYSATFSAVLQDLAPGDRLVLGRISGQAVANYMLDLDVTLPKTNVYIDDAEARDSVLAVAESIFTRIMQDRGANKSDILSAVTIAGELFTRDTTRSERSLVLLSDMLQDSDALNLSRERIDSLFTSEFVRRERAAGSIPDLSSVRVRVVGAGARDHAIDSYVALKNFWLTYFREAGAVMQSSDYGRTAVVALGR